MATKKAEKKEFITLGRVNFNGSLESAVRDINDVIAQIESELNK